MERIFVVGFLIVSLLLAGCVSLSEQQRSSSSSSLSTRAQANEYFNLLGVHATVVQEGETVIVEYDPPQFTYEYEAVNDWGKIFGTVSTLYPHARFITIRQKYAGEPLFEITANSSDVRLVLNDSLSVSSFKRRLTFRSLSS